VSEVTYYRRRQESGGLKTEQMKGLKDLQLENSRLRKLPLSNSPSMVIGRRLTGPKRCIVIAPALQAIGAPAAVALSDSHCEIGTGDRAGTAFVLDLSLALFALFDNRSNAQPEQNAKDSGHYPQIFPCT
jgi:hypothetical protein